MNPTTTLTPHQPIGLLAAPRPRDLDLDLGGGASPRAGSTAGHRDAPGGPSGAGTGGAVDCVVFSPQPGPAATLAPAAHLKRAVAGVREIFDHLRLVLVAGGVVWLDVAEPATNAGGDVTGLAWSMALAARADGWVLRNAITCTSTPARTLFLLTRDRHYYFALPTRDTTTTPASATRWPAPTCCRRRRRAPDTSSKGPHRAGSSRRHYRSTGCAGGVDENRSRRASVNQRFNPGDVWWLPGNPDPDDGCSCAADPRAGLSGGGGSVIAAARAIALGCPPSGVVYDPLAVCGHGAAARAAHQLSRRFHPGALPGRSIANGAVSGGIGR
jgi:hypothetical protein